MATVSRTGDIGDIHKDGWIAEVSFRTKVCDLRSANMGNFTVITKDG